jgi:hypothetical protein
MYFCFLLLFCSLKLELNKYFFNEYWNVIVWEALLNFIYSTIKELFPYNLLFDCYLQYVAIYFIRDELPFI